jgi:hypothetical protein
VPPTLPPLVSGVPERPGILVELLDAVGERSGWIVSMVPRPAMAGGNNPASWQINRGQCDILAGNIQTTDLTRGFLDLAPTGLTGGWVSLLQPGATLETADTVAFFSGAGGADRIELGAWLRSQGIAVALVPDVASLRAGLADGTYDGAITDAWNAAAATPDGRWEQAFLPGRQDEIAIGFWKGDSTLRRHVGDLLAAFSSDGTTKAVVAKYTSGAE